MNNKNNVKIGMILPSENFLVHKCSILIEVAQVTYFRLLNKWTFE